MYFVCMETLYANSNDPAERKKHPCCMRKRGQLQYRVLEERGDEMLKLSVKREQS